MRYRVTVKRGAASLKKKVLVSTSVTYRVDNKSNPYLPLLLPSRTVTMAKYIRLEFVYFKYLFNASPKLLFCMVTLTQENQVINKN